MHPVVLAILLGFIFAIVIAVVLVRKMRSYLAQIALALLLTPPALFCVFGFAATFEPMDAVTQWSFRVGYVMLGLGLAATSVVLLVKRPAAGKPSTH